MSIFSQTFADRYWEHKNNFYPVKYRTFLQTNICIQKFHYVNLFNKHWMTNKFKVYIQSGTKCNFLFIFLCCQSASSLTFLPNYFLAHLFDSKIYDSPDILFLHYLNLMLMGPNSDDSSNLVLDSVVRRWVF